MTQDSTNHKALVQAAYDAVKELDAPTEYKLEGYRIILKSMAFGSSLGTGNGPIAHRDTTTQKEDAPTDWQSAISSKIGITPDQVSEIYHLKDGIVELIVEGKDLPKTNSKATRDIVALLTAGRQAMGTERVTSIDVLRQACEYYRVYDSKNFMKYTKQLGSKFRFDGANSNTTVELTNGAFKIAGEVAAKYLGAK